jgi:hypothetical protein
MREACDTELLGSLYGYEEVSPFDVEYQGQIVTVRRADLR